MQRGGGYNAGVAAAGDQRKAERQFISLECQAQGTQTIVFLAKGLLRGPMHVYQLSEGINVHDVPEPWAWVAYLDKLKILG